jgi:hypothetical protein
MKVLCNADRCRFNIIDKDENNSYGRKCSLKELELYLDYLPHIIVRPTCFSYEGGGMQEEKP